MSANVRSIASPNFPVAPKDYNAAFMDQFINVLRLHLNNSANAINAPKVFGSYWSTSNATNPVANTARPMQFDKTAIAYNTKIGSPSSRIYVAETAVYNIQFSAQFNLSSGSNGPIYVWLRINGTDVASSAGKVVISGPNAEVMPAWNYVLLLEANDYIEIVWSSPDTHAVLEYVAAAAPVPAASEGRGSVLETTRSESDLPGGCAHEKTADHR